ncbi:MAG: amidohydrolase family protein [Desulfobacterales bacterium]|nr:amidohydrolase family protein [Desulfobacterales bacterium]
MKIIDAHMHFSNLESFKYTADNISKLDYSARGLKKEFRDSNVILGVGMGVTEAERGSFPCAKAENPMGLDLGTRTPANVACCVGINPVQLEYGNRDKILSVIEKTLKRKNIVGIKIYAGYYHFYVYDNIYEPVYELAAQYKLPVVFHGGDPYSEKALLKYSHPLAVDELAMMHRDVNFVIAHMGNPWVMDTANVVLKNENVFTDMSGLFVGDKIQIQSILQEPLQYQYLKTAMLFTSNFDKYLFGTDWPLAPIKPYANLIKQIVPEKHYEKVFYNNALNVFPKIKALLGDIR